MAILQIANYSKYLTFDGTSNSVTLDFQEQIEADTAIHNKVPVGIMLASDSLNNGTSNGLLSASLSGTKITFVWVTAPTTSQYAAPNVSVWLTFNP